MSAFGRVDTELNVYLIDGGVERKVGQYLLGGPEEALAFYEAKFSEFLSKVVLLEQRASSGKANARALVRSLEGLVKELDSLNAIGDFSAARSRLAAMSAGLAEKATVEAAAQTEERAQLLAKKEALATQAEAIASRKNPNWKQSSQEMDTLFASWQELQKSAVRVPKAETDPIWKRFSAARKAFEAGKRAYFAELDQRQKRSRSARQTLIESAEAIDHESSNALANYRALIDQWKALGKSSKQDEALWLRMKAAGDRIYAVKKQKDAEEDELFKSNLVLKEQLLAEAEKIDFSNLVQARDQFRTLQTKWNAAGKVPRNQLAKISERWEKIKKRLAEAEASNWKRTDTATIDRSSALTSQLEAAIADLEERLKQASAKDRSEIESQLEVRKGWLAAARAAVA